MSCNGNNGKKDNPALIAALLAAGADVRARAFGRTALHFASKAGFVETVRLLLAAGADANAVDDDGLTPLWSAMQSGPSVRREPVVRLLLGGGADPEVPNAKGVTLAEAVAADEKRPRAEQRALLELLA